MEERGLLVLCALLTLLSVVSVSGQFGYGDRFSDGVDDPYGASGGGGDGRANAVDDDIACPDFGPMDSFNAEGLQRGKYLGRWYQQQRQSSSSLEKSDRNRCWSQVYTRRSGVNRISNNPYKLKLDMEFGLGEDGRPKTVGFDVQVPDAEDANLLTYNVEPFDVVSRSYRILATDYDGFAIEYTCQGGTHGHKDENIWILTRDRTPSSRTMRRAFKSLGMLGLSDNARSVQTCYRNPAAGRKQTNLRPRLRRLPYPTSSAPTLLPPSPSSPTRAPGRFVSPVPGTAAPLGLGPPVRRSSNSWTSTVNSMLWSVLSPWSPSRSHSQAQAPLSSIAGIRRLNPPSAMPLRRRSGSAMAMEPGGGMGDGFFMRHTSDRECAYASPTPTLPAPKRTRRLRPTTPSATLWW